MEEKKSSVARNAVMNALLQLCNMLFPLISFPYITRIFSIDTLGKIQFYNTLGNYAVMLTGLGISTYGIKAIAIRRDDGNALVKCVRELTIIKIFSTTIVIMCLVALYHINGAVSQDSKLLSIQILYITVYIFNIDWVFNGIEKYAYITRRAVIVRMISLVMLFIFVKEEQDYLWYAIITISTSIVSTCINHIYFCRLFPTNIKTNIEIKKHIKPCFTLFGAILAVSIYTSLDTVMLDFICGNRDVGLYVVAVKIKTILLTLVNSISAVLLPRLSYYVDNGNTTFFKKMLRQSISFSILCSLSLTLFFMIEAKNSILILAGVQYLDSVRGMIILMPILFISGISNIMGNQVLIPTNRENCFTKAVSVGALVDFILNLFLMPKLGFIGAAIATLIAEISQASVQLYYSKDIMIECLEKNEMKKIMVSLFISSTVLFFLSMKLKNSMFVDFMISALAFWCVTSLSLFLMKSSTFSDIIEFILSKKNSSKV